MKTMIIGAAASKFGMFTHKPLRVIANEAITEALADAGVSASEVGLTVVGNAAAGLIGGQEMIRAHTTLAASTLLGRPTMAVENACASSSTAFYIAHLAIQAGEHDVVVVVGAEKMTAEDKTLAGKALATAVDIEAAREEAADSDKPRPVFMEIYAANARAYMERSGATESDFAAVVAKNTHNGSLNPIAQIRKPMTVEEVLSARVIVAPLTRPMCAGIGDGAAVLVVCSEEFARKKGKTGPTVRAIMLGSGGPERHGDLVAITAKEAYNRAGVGPRDISVVELHDAAAPAEIMIPEELGLVEFGAGPSLIRDGTSRIGGRLPINPSGGLTARGHPIGATGAAQIVELVDQLRGRGGERQVAGARLGLAENAGGSIMGGGAACTITILEA